MAQTPIVQLFAAPPPAPWDATSLQFMQADLQRSGLLPEDLGAYPISATKYSAPAYVIPYKGNDRLWRVRIDREKDKYIATPKVDPDIWIPPSTSIEEMYDGDLYIVEGEKKAAAVYKYWQLANVVGIGGCWNAVHKSDKNETYKLIEKLQLLITPGRVVHLILDGDVIENKHVGRAALTLCSCIEALNSTMYLYRPPQEWKGVDDWIYQDANAVPQRLELVPYDKLAINRTLLYSQLGCSLNEQGGLIANELNAIKLITYHFRSLGIIKDKRLGFISPTDQVLSYAQIASAALHYLQGDISPRYPAGAINGALADYLATNNSEQDLVKDMVQNRLQWDGVKRLDTWGSEYFESEIPKLAAEWGRLLITSLTMRILEPGCKIDCVYMLCGKQGIGKTTFFEDLAVIDKYSFYKTITDLPGSTGDDRTFKQTITAGLIVDLGEGIIFESRKTSSDRLKQFITERADEYRVAYAKTNTVSPRGYILVGTTNRSDQLSDLTGSRRFLYLTPTKIIKLPYEIKLQLIAEAASTMPEIKSGNWYDLRLTMDDLPKKITEEHEHIESVSEMLNTQHYRADALSEKLQIMIEGHDFSTLAVTGEQVATATFIASQLGTSSVIQATNVVGRKLTELSASPQFPYTFEKTRKRGAQMNYKQGHKELYTGHITNDQVMFTCFIIRKK